MNPLLYVDSYKIHHSTYKLVDQVSKEEENKGALKTVFENGELLIRTNLTEIRERLNNAHD